MSRRRGGADAGFTLIELMISITIMGIITVPLLNFVISYFTAQNSVQDRLADYHDLQQVSAFFSQDVANSGLRGDASPYDWFSDGTYRSVWTSGFGSAYCGSSLSGTPLLQLQYDDASGSDGAPVTYPFPTHAISYVAKGKTLYRVYCADATSPSTSPSMVPVVDNLDTSSTPTVTCYPATGSTAMNCNTGSGVEPPAKISLTIGVRAGRETTTTSFTLTGQRRLL